MPCLSVADSKRERRNPSRTVTESIWAMLRPALDVKSLASTFFDQRHALEADQKTNHTVAQHRTVPCMLRYLCHMKQQSRRPARLDSPLTDRDEWAHLSAPLVSVVPKRKCRIPRSPWCTDLACSQTQTRAGTHPLEYKSPTSPIAYVRICTVDHNFIHSHQQGRWRFALRPL